MNRNPILILLFTAIVFQACDRTDVKPDPPAGAFVYGGEHNEAAYDVVETAGGDFLVLGAAQQRNGVDYDMQLMLVDRNGTERWARTYGEQDLQEVGHSIIPTTNGFLLFGMSAYSRSSGMKFLLYQLDQDYNVVVKKEYPAQANYLGQYLGRGGYQLANGTFMLAYASSDQAFLMYLDQNLEQTAIEELDVSGFGPQPYFLTQTADGGFTIFEGLYNYSPGEPSYSITRKDAFGVTTWSADYVDPDGGASILGVAAASDGGYYVTYYNWNTYIHYLMRTDSAGQMIWRADLEQQLNFTNVVERADGSVAVCGGTEFTGGYYATNQDALALVRADSAGTITSRTSYGGKESDRILRMIEAGDGRLVLVGNTTSYGAGGSDVLLIFHEQ